MKITISKSQWLEMGKKAGWTKKAQINEKVQKGIEKINEIRNRVSDFQYSFNDYNGTFSLKIDGAQDTSKSFNSDYTFIVSGDFSFRSESEQRGGETDPSWDAHLEYEGMKITSLKCIEQPEETKGMPISPKVIDGVKYDVEMLINNISDGLAEELAKQH
jgi:hypothetical protein